MTENISPLVTDILPIVSDPLGIPLTQKVTLTNLKTGLALVKDDVGLGNCDDTSDADKPVSTAQQTALDAKLDDSQATAFGLSLLDDANAAAGRATLELGNVDNTSDATKQTATITAIYPVGAIYISTASTNPATLFGFGTWSAFGAGKMLVSLDSGDTDFDTAEETGGAKTKTIAQANLPNISTGAGTAHTHIQDSHNHTQDAHTHTQNAHSHVITSQTATTGSATSYEHGTLDTSSAETEATETTNTTVATNQNTTATNQAATATNQNESTHTHSLGGSGTALNVMNPYIVVYIFKRTA